MKHFILYLVLGLSGFEQVTAQSSNWTGRYSSNGTSENITATIRQSGEMLEVTMRYSNGSKRELKGNFNDGRIYVWADYGSNYDNDSSRLVFDGTVDSSGRNISGRWILFSGNYVLKMPNLPVGSHRGHGEWVAREQGTFVLRATY